jgi:GDP-4-dehydro-6-deoxy-D-mannose reductase
VRDVVRAYALLLAHGVPGEVYNVARGEGVTLRTLFERIAALVGVAAEPVTDPALSRASDIPYRVGDAAKLRAATGWTPTLSLDRTLRDVLDAQEN